MTRPARRRGACPALATPMPTGDGLLVRLHPPGRRLSGAQLLVLAQAAAALGSGIVEVSARGHLQVRGLAPDRLIRLREALAAAGLENLDGPQVEIPPLAGIARDEVADSSGLAARIAAVVAECASGLAPKTVVTVDGGGGPGLGNLTADIRLSAQADGWRLAVGGTALTARAVGFGSSEAAGEAAEVLLRLLAADGGARRGRALDATVLARAATGLRSVAGPEPRREARSAGLFALRDGRFARGIVLPFGYTTAAAMAGLARLGGPEAQWLTAPGHGLLLANLDGAGADRLEAGAAALGFAVAAGDPRLAVTACAGAPFCDAAWLQTRPLAALLAGGRGTGGGRLHLSGCEKRCAAPEDADLAITGSASGVLFAGREGGVTGELRAAVLRYHVSRPYEPDVQTHGEADDDAGRHDDAAADL